MIFDGIVLLSDIDGTLSTYDRKILPENIEAIRYFTENGGRFAVATGRTAHSAIKMIRDLPVNCPCIVVNGAGIYDTVNKETLFACYLDHSACRIFDLVVEQCPNVGIEINVEGVLKCIRYSKRSQEHIEYELGSFTQYTLADIPKESNWFKALFTGEPDLIDQVERLCLSMLREDDPFYFVRSEPTLFEVLPKGATKGEGVKRLSGILNIPIDNFYAIGDYYNDIDFLKAAGFSAAVAGAPKEVLAVTDYHACPCEEGAVADFIRFIEEKIKKSH